MSIALDIDLFENNFTKFIRKIKISKDKVTNKSQGQLMDSTTIISGKDADSRFCVHHLEQDLFLNQKFGVHLTTQYTSRL